MSFVTLVHPAKATENEMPFGRNSRVAPSNIVLHKGPGPSTKGEDFGVGTHSSQRYRLLPNYFGPCFLSNQMSKISHIA